MNLNNRTGEQTEHYGLFPLLVSLSVFLLRRRDPRGGLAPEPRGPGNGSSRWMIDRGRLVCLSWGSSRGGDEDASRPGEPGPFINFTKIQGGRHA